MTQRSPTPDPSQEGCCSQCRQHLQPCPAGQYEGIGEAGAQQAVPGHPRMQTPAGLMGKQVKPARTHLECPQLCLPIQANCQRLLLEVMNVATTLKLFFC